MYAFYNLLWSKLPEKKYCSSCKCLIWGENKTYYWDHLIDKSPHEELAFEEENMYFCCGDCHTLKTSGFPTEPHKKAIEKAKKRFGVE